MLWIEDNEKKKEMKQKVEKDEWVQQEEKNEENGEKYEAEENSLEGPFGVPWSGYPPQIHNV